MQACQVFYLPYPVMKHEQKEWLDVCCCQPKFFDEGIVVEDDIVCSTDMAFQADEPTTYVVTDPTNDIGLIVNPTSSNMISVPEDSDDDEEDQTFTSITHSPTISPTGPSSSNHTPSSHSNHSGSSSRYGTPSPTISAPPSSASPAPSGGSHKVVGAPDRAPLRCNGGLTRPPQQPPFRQISQYHLRREEEPRPILLDFPLLLSLLGKTVGFYILQKYVLGG
ncbi:hypothetical protein Scep_030026 [Stephania cephalantha]|uniref:Uncharacterized protein n=1 Tax=Stephania cephalantha TaxID=152367 RepID=A0AAP0E1P9_9MAGN